MSVDMSQTSRGDSRMGGGGAQDARIAQRMLIIVGSALAILVILHVGLYRHVMP